MSPALKLYQAAESAAGQPGARKRWRLACHALAPLVTDSGALQAYGTAQATHKRADWRTAAKAMAAAMGAVEARPVIIKPERRPLTLLEFLAAAGGLQDTQGDLKAIDAHLWHKAAPFRRKLVNPAGLDLGYAADLAYERGYFDDTAPASWDGADNMHPVTPAAFLLAIVQELNGRPRLPNAVENAPYYVAPEPDDSERLYAEAWPESVDDWAAGYGECV